MSKTPEQKVGEQLANLTESQWFNPAVLGRYLADQPFFTNDRVIELIAHIVKEQSKIHNRAVVENGTSSEGLILANELYECIKAYQEVNKLNNLKLPSSKPFVAKAEEPKEYKLGWVHDRYDNATSINVQAVIM